MTTAVEKIRGDDWSFPFTWRDAGGTGINLTGYTVGADFYRTNIGDPIQLTEGNGITVTDRATGKFVVEIARATTADATPDKATAISFPNRLQVYVIDPNGDRQTLGVIPIRVTAP